MKRSGMNGLAFCSTVTLALFAAAQLRAETVILASAPQYGGHETVHILNKVTGKTDDIENPYILKVYSFAGQTKTSWSVRTRQRLTIALNEKQTSIIAVTGDMQTWQTTVQTYSIDSGDHQNEYVIDDFLPTFNWNGNGPADVNNLQKAAGADRFYLLGYQKEQPTGSIEIRKGGYSEPAPAIPTIVRITPHAEIGRFRLNAAPGDFANFASSLQSSQYILLSSYNVALGDGKFLQYSLVNVNDERVVVCNPKYSLGLFISYASLTLHDDKLVVLNGEQDVCSILPKEPPYAETDHAPILGLTDLHSIEYVHGNASTKSLPIILNSWPEQIHEAPPKGESELAIFDTASHSLSLKSPRFNKPTSCAILSKTSSSEKYYCLNGNDLVILDARLTVLDTIPTELDWPYRILVVP